MYGTNVQGAYPEQHCRADHILFCCCSDLPSFIMAGEAIRQLEEQLNCSICLDIYTDPKLLQCFHTYCRKCLVKLVVRDQQGDLSLTCPICRQATPVPANGVAGLQSAFQTNEFLRIREDLIKKRDIAGSLVGSKVDATPLTPSTIKIIPNCYEHVDKERELYCETCEVLICYKCAFRGGKHEGHDCDEIKNAYERYKEEVRPSLKLMESKLNAVKKVLAQLNTCCGEVSDQREVIEDSVHNAIRGLHQLLDVRKTELISVLHQITQAKLKGLAAQRDEMETIQAQLSSCLDFVRKSLETESQGDVLTMKENIVKQVKELIIPFKPDTLKPNTEADMKFSSSPDVTTACRNYGKVYAVGDPDPSQCQATGKGLETAVVGEKSTAILQTINFSSEPCSRPIKSLECELVSEITGSRVIGNIERRGQNQYKIEYRPTMKGKHQFHVKVEGHHIRKSPFSVAVKLSVEKLGNPILTIDRVKGPLGVAVNQRGEVVVAECSGHCVSVFNQYGKELRSFGTHGSGYGQFKYPHGVAVDSKGNILVTDTDNHRIQKFTTTGEFLTAAGTKGSGPLQFNRPSDVTFNATNNKVYVIDTFNHRVQVLTSDLTFSSTFGKEGSGKGQFKSPSDIACDRTGKVYIADSDNCHIQVFTAGGKFLRMFGRCGEGRGELNWPAAITVDTNDIVYVSEFHNRRVSVFTCEGQFVTSFGRKGEGPGEFNSPSGIAVDNCGVVYVCDFFNNRIQCF